MHEGRPSKLTPEMMEKARGYLATCIDNVELTEKGALAFIEVTLPSIVGLALYLGIDKQTVHDWCRVDSDRFNAEFSYIVKDILQEQEKRLVEKGLGGMYTGKALAAMLSKHGYHEKVETDVTTKGESINSPVISELTRQLNELYRGTNSSSDGGATSSLGSEAPDTK